MEQGHYPHFPVTTSPIYTTSRPDIIWHIAVPVLRFTHYRMAASKPTVLTPRLKILLIRGQPPVPAYSRFYSRRPRATGRVASSG